MKTAKHLMFLLAMSLGVGCATDLPAADQSEPTNQTDQEIGGGGSCPAHDNCYSLCRFAHKCNHDAECDKLSDCLDQCDADYPTCV